MTLSSEGWEGGGCPPAAQLLEVASDLFLSCDGEGRITWSDQRAQDTLDVRPGRLFLDLVAAFNRGKAEWFLKEARDHRTDTVELIFSAGGELVLLALRGGPHQQGVLISANRLPQTYVALHEQLTATLNEIAALHRESTRRQHELVATNVALERATEALMAQARLEGVVLSARELAHVLNNDLTVPVIMLDLLHNHEDVPPTLVPTLDAIASGLDIVSQHVSQFLKVVRVVIKETAQGPALDLGLSSAHPPPNGTPSS